MSDVRWNALAPEQVVELASALAAWDWPVAAEQIPDLASALGWTVATGRIYATNVGLKPGVAMFTVTRDEVASLEIGLVDYSKEESQERDDFIQDVAGAYVLALKERFGESVLPPFPRREAVSTWDLGSGARLALVSSPTLAQLVIESPTYAGDKKLLRQKDDPGYHR